MKEKYVSPEAKLVGIASEQPTAAFEFDDLLLQGVGKQNSTTVSGYDVAVNIREYY